MAHCKAKIIANNSIERVKLMEIILFLTFTQLAYCIVQFLEKDPGLTEQVRIMIHWNPVVRPPHYHCHFILAQTKSRSVIFLFKEPYNLTTLSIRPDVCGLFVTRLTAFHCTSKCFVWVGRITIFCLTFFHFLLVILFCFLGSSVTNEILA